MTKKDSGPGPTFSCKYHLSFLSKWSLQRAMAIIPLHFFTYHPFFNSTQSGLCFSFATATTRQHTKSLQIAILITSGFPALFDNID